MHIQVSQLSYRYDGSADAVFTSISCTLTAGWTAFVGDNGSGKTTLARLIIGQLPVYEGSVYPRVDAAVYCAQDAREEPEALFDLAADWTAHGVEMRRRFGVDDEWLWRYQTLSSGQQKRVQLACALWQEPDVLVLDEPSNHIDADTRQALIAALSGYRGIGVLISHDRELLDALATSCVLFDAGSAQQYAGNYSEAQAQQMATYRRTKAERQVAQRELTRLQAERVRRVGEAQAAQAKRSKAHIDPKDKDAKGRIDLAIYTGKDGVAGKLSTRLNGRIAAAQERVANNRVTKRYDGSIEPFGTRMARTSLVELPEGFLSYDRSLRGLVGCGHHATGAFANSTQGGAIADPMQDDALVTSVPDDTSSSIPDDTSSSIPDDTSSSIPGVSIPHLMVGSTSHVALIGANGLGKSTLVEELIAHIPEDVAYLYLPQELTAHQVFGYIQRLRELSAADRGRVLSTIAQLNSKPEAFVSALQAPAIASSAQHVAEHSPAVEVKHHLAGERSSVPKHSLKDEHRSNTKHSPAVELSPGEVRKLALALAVLDNPALLVLDEPTNHLDIHSVEALTQFLQEFVGAVVLVSHDMRLVTECCEERWLLMSCDGKVITKVE